MATLELELPDQLARDARKAGLLSAKAIKDLLRDAIRKRAAQEFLAVADRVAAAKILPMSEEEIQAEVNAVREAKRRARARRR